MDPTHTIDELDHLIRALSHDMRANYMVLEHSFGKMKQSLDGLLSEEPPEQLGEQVLHVEACMRQSKRFLEDLAALAGSGRVEMEPARVELAAVVDEVLYEQRELLQSRGVDVVAESPLPVLWCNADRLKQVVTNLVRNAVRHGCDATEPRITIASTIPGEDSGGDSRRRMLAFRVHDNGPGIDARFRDAVFRPGRRLDSAHPEGSGMGLAIVRKIVEHYGGSVGIDAHCPQGTAFVVEIGRAHV